MEIDRGNRGNFLKMMGGSIALAALSAACAPAEGSYSLFTESTVHGAHFLFL